MLMSTTKMISMKPMAKSEARGAYKKMQIEVSPIFAAS